MSKCFLLLVILSFCPNWAKANVKKIGEITFLRGKVIRNQKRLQENDKVFLKDIIQTSSGSEVKIQFSDGNQVFLFPNSEIELDLLKQADEKDTQYHQFLRLKKGILVAKVDPVYRAHEDCSFYVYSPSGEVKVRGSRFYSSYHEKDKKFEVAIFEGGLELRTLDQNTKLNLNKGHRASVENNQISEIGEISNSQYIAMSKIQSESSNTVSEMKKCSSPEADTGQCSWTCVGKKKGKASYCPVNREGVFCVRKRCDEHAQWVDDMRMPSSFGSNCLGQRVRVADCN